MSPRATDVPTACHRSDGTPEFSPAITLIPPETPSTEGGDEGPADLCEVCQEPRADSCAWHAGPRSTRMPASWRREPEPAISAVEARCVGCGESAPELAIYEPADLWHSECWRLATAIEASPDDDDAEAG